MTKECQVTSDSIHVPLTTFDTVIEWLLAALLAFMPFALGAREAWSEEVVIAVSGAIVICFLLKLVFHRNQGIIWTWAYVPVGVFFTYRSAPVFFIAYGHQRQEDTPTGHSGMLHFPGAWLSPSGLGLCPDQCRQFRWSCVGDIVDIIKNTGGGS